MPKDPIINSEDPTVLKSNDVKVDSSNRYVLDVPENGAAQVPTTIESRDHDSQDAQGCSHILFDILHSLGLTK